MLVRQGVPLRRPEATSESARWLEAMVRRLAVPRHATHEEPANRAIADFLAYALESYGYRVSFQGRWRNVVALPPGPGPYTLVCAHYDSVPGTPGADDNASAVAVLLGAARSRPPNTAFVAFNREEDGMVGSEEFVQWLGEPGAPEVGEVHVLEMLGYTDYTPGSQLVPPPLPKFLLPRDVADFVAVVGLGKGSGLAARVRKAADGALGVPPVVSLQAPAQILRVALDLGRSDHLPFVVDGRPAVMWTDTADFRTPHYHQRSDTPETLDYSFMAGVQRLLVLTLSA